MNAAGTDGSKRPPALIALVDDNTLTTRVAQIHLRRFAPEFADAEFVLGRTGGDAVALCFADRLPDVMMVNGVMPRMWGTEAIRRIREREAAGGLPPVPIVFESAAEALIDEALSDGADAATGLPLDAPWLVACFRWALGAPASSLLAERFRDHPESLVPAFVMAADRLEGRVPRRGVMRWFHAPSPALDGAWPADRVGDPAAFAAALEAEAALHS